MFDDAARALAQTGVVYPSDLPLFGVDQRRARLYVKFYADHSGLQAEYDTKRGEWRYFDPEKIETGVSHGYFLKSGNFRLYETAVKPKRKRKTSKSDKK